jgi:hypothetical protein
MEFVVDGERLGQILGPFLGYGDATDEYVPVLVTDWPADIALEDFDRLLGAGAPPQLGGRTAMYVCAECGDLGCGAVTAVVEVDGDKIVWREFGYQNDYEPFEPGRRLRRRRAVHVRPRCVFGCPGAFPLSRQWDSARARRRRRA